VILNGSLPTFQAYDNGARVHAALNGHTPLIFGGDTTGPQLDSQRGLPVVCENLADAGFSAIDRVRFVGARPAELEGTSAPAH